MFESGLQRDVCGLIGTRQSGRRHGAGTQLANDLFPCFGILRRGGGGVEHEAARLHLRIVAAVAVLIQHRDRSRRSRCERDGSGTQQYESGPNHVRHAHHRVYRQKKGAPHTVHTISTVPGPAPRSDDAGTTQTDRRFRLPIHRQHDGSAGQCLESRCELRHPQPERTRQTIGRRSFRQLAGHRESGPRIPQNGPAAALIPRDPGCFDEVKGEVQLRVEKLPQQTLIQRVIWFQASSRDWFRRHRSVHRQTVIEHKSVIYLPEYEPSSFAGRAFCQKSDLLHPNFPFSVRTGGRMLVG